MGVSQVARGIGGSDHHREANMGREKEAQILNEEAARRRQKEEGDVCYICGEPASGRDPQGGGRLCGYHLNEMQKPD